jgi:hypothetical protein
MDQSEHMRFGPHTTLVNDLLRWIGRGELLRFGTLPPEYFIAVSELDEALSIAEGRGSGKVDWTSLRENADASLYEVGLLDTDAWLSYKAGIKSLLSLVADKVTAVLPEDYFAVIDDVIADLHACALCLAIHGRLDQFHDRLWAAYACGGWPCGCTGEEPMPPDYELELEDRKFYIFWRMGC